LGNLSLNNNKEASMRKIKTLLVAGVALVLSGCATDQALLDRLELVEETAKQAISAADANSHRLNQMFYEQQKK
tara:strand:+ start:508 stop:729 length:222 start_codon:yes stop_codon:yes gene_type:complete